MRENSEIEAQRAEASGRGSKPEGSGAGFFGKRGESRRTKSRVTSKEKMREIIF